MELYLPQSQYVPETFRDLFSGQPGHIIPAVLPPWIHGDVDIATKCALVDALLLGNDPNAAAMLAHLTDCSLHLRVVGAPTPFSLALFDECKRVSLGLAKLSLARYVR